MKLNNYVAIELATLLSFVALLIAARFVTAGLYQLRNKNAIGLVF